MKYFVTVFLSLFLTYGFSQVWIDSSATWTYDYWNVSEQGTIRWEYTRDSIIQGRNSQIIKQTKFRYGGPFSGVINEGEVYTTVSNDSVFYWRDNQFLLLYDFGASIGDTWLVSIDSADSACEDSAFVEVINIGSTIINGNNLRTLTLQLNSNSFRGVSGVVTERFGSPSGLSFGFLPGYFGCQGSSTIYEFSQLTFRCYEDKTFSNYNPSGKNCDTLTANSINEIDSQNLILYPNPTNDNLRIDLPNNKISNISIIDIYGKLLSQHYSTQNIDVSNLISGVYYLRVVTDKEIIITKPFVKE